MLASLAAHPGLAGSDDDMAHLLRLVLRPPLARWLPPPVMEPSRQRTLTLASDTQAWDGSLPESASELFRLLTTVQR
jgi:hypothetical protein